MFKNKLNKFQALSVLCIAFLAASAEPEPKSGGKCNKVLIFLSLKLPSSAENDVEDELEKLLMSELVPQLHELASRSGEFHTP